MGDTQRPTAHLSGILQGIAYRTLQNHLTDTLDHLDLSIPEWKLLGLLNDTPDARVVDLSKTLGIEPPLTTRLVTKLVKAGFVTEKKSNQDKRVVYLSVSDSGLKLLMRCEFAVRSTLNQLLSGITRDELEIYKNVLLKIIGNGKTKPVTNNFAND